MSARSTRASGQTLVEFALILPILLIGLVGIFDAGRLIYTQNTISNASREGVRLAIVNQNEAAVQAHARAAMHAIDPTAASFAPLAFAGPACSPAVKLGCKVTVVITYPWRAITPVIGNIIGPISLRAATTMPVERIYQQVP